MQGSDILIFATALFVASGTPGPATTALVSRTMAGGAPAGTRFGLGLMVGDLVWLSCAMFGVATLIGAAPRLFTALQVGGAAYLLWLAVGLWTSKRAHGPGQPRTVVLGGLFVALSNPKTMLFYVALLPALVSLRRLTFGDALAAAAIVVTVYGLVIAGYIALALQIRGRTGAAWPPLNRVSAVIMAATALYILSTLRGH